MAYYIPTFIFLVMGLYDGTGDTDEKLRRLTDSIPLSIL
jgi:hypothetical protein